MRHPIIRFISFLVTLIALTATFWYIYWQLYGHLHK